MLSVDTDFYRHLDCLPLSRSEKWGDIQVSARVYTYTSPSRLCVILNAFTGSSLEWNGIIFKNLIILFLYMRQQRHLSLHVSLNGFTWNPSCNLLLRFALDYSLEKPKSFIAVVIGYYDANFLCKVNERSQRYTRHSKGATKLSSNISLACQSIEPVSLHRYSK